MQGPINQKPPQIFNDSTICSIEKNRQCQSLSLDHTPPQCTVSLIYYTMLFFITTIEPSFIITMSSDSFNFHVECRRGRASSLSGIWISIAVFIMCRFTLNVSFRLGLFVSFLLSFFFINLVLQVLEQVFQKACMLRAFVLS